VSELITNGTATLTNYTGGARVKGVWTEGTPATSTRAASCQPDKGAQYASMQATGNRRITYVKMFVPAGTTVLTEAQFGPVSATTFTHPAFPNMTFRVLSAEWRHLDDPAHILVRAASIDESEARA
jgi:hypothetical protein